MIEEGIKMTLCTTTEELNKRTCFQVFRQSQLCASVMADVGMGMTITSVTDVGTFLVGVACFKRVLALYFGNSVIASQQQRILTRILALFL